MIAVVFQVVICINHIFRYTVKFSYCVLLFREIRISRNGKTFFSSISTVNCMLLSITLI